MTLSSDVIDGSDILKAYVVDDNSPEMMPFDDDPQLESVQTIYPHTRCPNTARGMVFPSIIAKPTLHDTPRILYIVQGLGEGTMGRVFLTLDSGTSKLYAMKVFKKDYVSACGEVQSTVAERGILAETRDNLFTVNLHSSFQDESRLYMLLDFCVGGDLATELSRFGNDMPMENVMYNAAHLVEGIASLHALGIIHRDLKPENVLLTARGDIKISDFGSAIRVPSHDVWVEPTSHFGTAAYLPPEVFLGCHNCSLDWWCLGIIIYEMIMGKHPFLPEATHDGQVDMEELAESISNGEYNLPDTLDGPTRRLIRGLLKLNPQRRYGADEVRNSTFFEGWDWEMVRHLGYMPPPRPNKTSTRVKVEGGFNFNPEFGEMDIDDEMTIDLEGVDPVDDPSYFPGFQCIPAYATALEASDVSYVQYQRRGLSIPHVPPPRRAFSTPNVTSMTSIEERSPQPQRMDSTAIYPQLLKSGCPDRPRDKRLSNLLTTMRICLAAITRFK